MLAEDTWQSVVAVTAGAVRIVHGVVAVIVVAAIRCSRLRRAAVVEDVVAIRIAGTGVVAAAAIRRCRRLPAAG